MSTGLTPAQKKIGDTKRNLRAVLEKGAQEFAAVLPAHLTPERMIRIAMTACTVQPKLLDCTQESVGLALLCASQCGLEPDGYHAHLVPYGKQCTFVPDFKGLIQLALENNVVIDAYAVYEKDEFAYQLGTQPKIHHIPYEGDDRGNLRCAYAVAHFGTDQVKFLVASKGDIEKQRTTSKSANLPDSPWKKWEAEMAIKTAVKMLAKFIPRSQRLRAALVHDDTAEMGLQQNPLTIDVVGARKLPVGISKTQATAERVTEEQDVIDMYPETIEDFAKLLEHITTERELNDVFVTCIEDRKDQLSADDYAQAVSLYQAKSHDVAATE